MDISNQKKATRIRRSYNGFIFLLLASAILWLVFEFYLIAIITGAILVVIIGIGQLLNLNYINYFSNEKVIRVRYYPLLTIGKRAFNEIYFKRSSLTNSQIIHRFLSRDLALSVKSGNGIASYPEVNLFGLSKKQIADIKNDLNIDWSMDC